MLHWKKNFNIDNNARQKGVLKVKNKMMVMLITIALLALTGCSTSPEPALETARLTFEVALRGEMDDGKIVARLGVRNAGNVEFPGDEAFGGVMELRDGSQALRSCGETMMMGRLAAGEATFPIEWKGELSPGAYTLTWGAPGYGATVVDFEVQESSGMLVIGEEVTRVLSTYEPQGCPGGADETGKSKSQALADRARSKLAEQLGVGVGEIAVQSVEATEFSDTSLGVPQPGQAYAQVITPGYTIKLVVNGVTYEYHGSNDRVVLVPRERERTGGSITIERVQTASDQQIIFAGRSTLPEGTCLQTQLFADGEPEAWWPSKACVPVQDGSAWQIVVPLAKGEAPEALDPGVQYMLRVWQEDLLIEAVFWFDLAGPPTPPTALHETLTPKEVTQGFYNWYLEYSRNQGNPLVSRAYRSSEYLTDQFAQKVDGLLDSFAGGGYDPFLCAQDFPEKVSIGSVVVSGQNAWVVVQTHWTGGATVRETTVGLKDTGGEWKVVDILCPMAADFGMAAWQLYRDESYGFQVKYPQDWTLKEAKINDPQGDLPIKRVLSFSPQEWRGMVTPASIEVGVGSLEKMQSMWPLPTEGQSSATTINGYVVFIGEGMYGEMFYILKHPTDSELWVAVRYNADGTSKESALQAGELRDVVNDMLSSFRFAE